MNIDKLTDGVGDNGLSRADFAIDYDPSVFSVASSDIFLGTVPGAGVNWNVAPPNFATGQLGISIATTTPNQLNLTIPAGSVDSLVVIDFHVLPGAAVATTSINLAASNSAGPTTTDLFDASGNAYAFGTAPTDGGTDAGVDGSVNVLPLLAAPPVGSWSGDPGSGSNVSPLTLTPTASGNNPGGIGTMLVLNDGSIMVTGGLDNNSQDWFRLTPDANGNYADGTWTRLASMSTQRLFFGSVVLKDGRVLVYGGEYSGANPAPASTDINTGEIFTPPTTATGTGSWQPITPIPATLNANNAFGDGQLELLNDGTVLAGDLNTGATYRYNPNNDPLLNPSLPAGTQPWSADATRLNGDRSNEETWVKLGDGSILTYENFGTAPQTGQRFVPGASQAADQWQAAGSVPVTLDTQTVNATGTIASAVGPGGSALITITSSNPLPTGFGTNSQVTISGVAGFPAANGTFPVTVTGANTFTLSGTAGTAGTATANTGGWSKNLVPGAELGPAFLLPDGRVFNIGATGSTALYTPPAAAGNATGTWVAGPTIPLGLGANDAPGAVLPDGRVLFLAGATPFFGPGINTINPVPTGTSLFEYDPVTNTISQVTDLPANFNTSLAGRAPFVMRMLSLPSGQVLITDSTGQPYLYTPTGGPDPSWRPTITGLSKNPDGSYTLAGTQLNGLSEGAAYGDDAQMATNYPIVELRDQAGNVSYAPTTSWTSAWVATGSSSESVQFSLPAGKNVSDYISLDVIASGVRSAPLVFGTGVGRTWT